MFLGIDLGGSKTLLAVFDGHGNLKRQLRLATPKKYQTWLKAIEQTLQILDSFEIKAVCCAVPGLVDRQKGLAVHFGTLPWPTAPLVKDLDKLLLPARVWIENDANLAGLSEAKLLRGKYRKVLYLTVSTGINDSVIIDGKIDPELADSEPGHMLLEHGGRLQKWQDFASGKAIIERFGQRASQLDDAGAWRQISHDLALGLNELVATLTPEVVVIGGGVGAHFKKFERPLKQALAGMHDNMVAMPPVVAAQRPETAVIYGCYDFIKQKAGGNDD